MFHPLSLLIPMAILLPNFVFLVLQPTPMPSEKQPKENPILSAAEGLGRLAVFILPVFAPLQMGSGYEMIALIGMLLSLAVYYVGWMRYFTGKRNYKLLFSPMAGVPVPLAISPVLFFLFAAVVLHSPYLFAGGVFLGIGHIPISLRLYSQTHK